MGAFRGEGTFHDLLAADPEVSALMSKEEVDRCFDIGHAVRHCSEIIDRALKMP
jgi:adenylosuccinate lyase